jgi:hypothetical protein
VDLPAAAAGGTAIYQAVSSPMHNVMPQTLRLGHRLVTSRLGALVTTAAARLAGVRPPRARWRITDGPWFATMLAELSYDGRRARIRFDRTAPVAPGASDAAGPAGPYGPPGLEPACEAELALRHPRQAGRVDDDAFRPVPVAHHPIVAPSCAPCLCGRCR